MKPVRFWRAGCAAGVLALAAGCSAPDATCSSEDVYGPDAGTTLVKGPDVSGEVVLSAEETSFSTAFAAVLDQLPQVWVGDEPLRQPTLAVKFELEYPDSQPSGAELPQVTAKLDTGRPMTSAWGTDAAHATITLGGQHGATGMSGVAPFVVCSSSSIEECCPYGASSCSGGATLQLSRDADVFPRVRVRYTATPSTHLYSCVDDDRDASWTLEETGQ